MGEGTLPPAAAPLALIVAPTRELALQVMRELTWLYAGAARGWCPAWAAWMPATNAARWSAARISWWARPDACATTSIAARST